jgi:Zn-dependent peptidase ImmA (M78 family)
MAISRIDLADAASPDRLVIEILKHEPDLPIPVPIERLCSQLDIVNIHPLTTAGFEGGLITDPDKLSGIILYNEASPYKRRRFTIAHELLHFLAPSHVPDAQGRFMCSQADMLLLVPNEQDRRRRMEVEANRFASLILMPPASFRRDVNQSNDPDLKDIIALSGKYQVSFEAVSRAYATFRSDPVAILVTQHARVLRQYRDDRRFPYITVSNNMPVPEKSLLVRRSHPQGVPSNIDETDAGVWIDVQRGKRAPILYEQVYAQREGFALLMLSMEVSDEDIEDRDAERTSKERYRERLARWRE